MIDPRNVCLYIPDGLSPFKQKLFDRIGAKVGRVVRGRVDQLRGLPSSVLPMVGCSPELTDLIAHWRSQGRPWCYWDRGYMRRVFATWLPRGENGGYYRFHLGSYQMAEVKRVSDDRLRPLGIDLQPWRKGGRHVVIAAPTRTYSRFHRTETWIADTIDALARVTDRQLVIRDKESKRSLQSDLDGAHALVTHGSIAAVESVVMGCPVFVDSSSAAALVGCTDLRKIESPKYPDRDEWMKSLSYSQFNEAELVDGTLWRLLS